MPNSFVLFAISNAIAPPTTPLLGFENESMTSRQLHYLLPFTKALKVLWGNNVRFHHLHHSGAHWLMYQGLLLSLGWDDSPFCIGNATQAMLTKQACQERFHFWLEGHDFSHINDGLLLFDVIGEQLGHSHYATTRWSYLHGIEGFPLCFQSMSMVLNTMNCAIYLASGHSLPMFFAF
ncbi:hypothetical protein [Photobacterium sp. GB-1]|uniref:hypothetical protein n=1 Tax=Photobacterium sp. GB-1 TaxID=2022111 RepID=UPI0011B28554|nr:hypothetical protein [Photobacterium sp. GB-1]